MIKNQISEDIVASVLERKGEEVDLKVELEGAAAGDFEKESRRNQHGYRRSQTEEAREVPCGSSDLKKGSREQGRQELLQLWEAPPSLPPKIANREETGKWALGGGLGMEELGTRTGISEGWKDEVKWCEECGSLRVREEIRLSFLYEMLRGKVKCNVPEPEWA